jgi:ribonuclease E
MSETQSPANELTTENLIADQASVEATPENNGTSGNGRRRGRRGGRRERGERSTETAAAVTSEVIPEHPAQTPAVVAEMPSLNEAPATLPSVALEVRDTPVVELPAAAPVISHIAEQTAPVVATEVVTTITTLPETTPTPTPTPAVPSPVALEAIGLQMVETDPDKRASVAAAPPEKPVRKPRKPRAKPVIVEEPLQMVETRKE